MARRDVRIGARGRVTAVVTQRVARAVVDGEAVDVVALRGGPMSCGDAVVVVRRAPFALVVDVRGGRTVLRA